jgi:hypothetical protein
MQQNRHRLAPGKLARRLLRGDERCQRFGGRSGIQVIAGRRNVNLRGGRPQHERGKQKPAKECGFKPAGSWVLM